MMAKRATQMSAVITLALIAVGVPALYSFNPFNSSEHVNRAALQVATNTPGSTKVPLDATPTDLPAYPAPIPNYTVTPDPLITQMSAQEVAQLHVDRTNEALSTSLVVSPTHPYLTIYSANDIPLPAGSTPSVGVIVQYDPQVSETQYSLDIVLRTTGGVLQSIRSDDLMYLIDVLNQLQATP